MWYRCSCGAGGRFALVFSVFAKLVALRKPSISESGYILIDAMVALLILALTIALGLPAIRHAEELARAAQERRNAGTLLSSLLNRGSQTVSVIDGTAAEFTWALQTAATGAERPIEVCHVSAEVHSRRSGRRFSASTLDICPPAPSA